MSRDQILFEQRSKVVLVAKQACERDSERLVFDSSMLWQPTTDDVTDIENSDVMMTYHFINDVIIK